MDLALTVDGLLVILYQYVFFKLEYLGLKDVSLHLLLLFLLLFLCVGNQELVLQKAMRQ